MKKLAIIGKNNISIYTNAFIQKVYKNLDTNYEPIYFVDNEVGSIEFIDNLEVINFNIFLEKYKLNDICGIILPKELFIGQTKIVFQLLMCGVNINDIYISDRISFDLLRNNREKNFISTYLNSSYLPYLEFHISDHCNLNCKACEHYSGLVQNTKFTNYEKFAEDFIKLKKYIDDIGVIRIMGGEPLLNPEINKYILLARNLYPLSIIYIVTNALLIMHMPDDFYATLRETNSRIHISFYPPVVQKIKEIYNFLVKRNIQVNVSPLMEKFGMRQILVPHNHPRETFYNCLQAHCHNIYEGHISACFLPFTTKYFNDAFNMHIPEDGTLNLYDNNLTTEKIKLHLSQPFERCRYCDYEVKVPWSIMHRPPIIEDWAR